MKVRHFLFGTAMMTAGLLFLFLATFVVQMVGEPRSYPQRLFSPSAVVLVVAGWVILDRRRTGRWLGYVAPLPMIVVSAFFPSGPFLPGILVGVALEFAAPFVLPLVEDDLRRGPGALEVAGGLWVVATLALVVINDPRPPRPTVALTPDVVGVLDESRLVTPRPGCSMTVLTMTSGQSVVVSRGGVSRACDGVGRAPTRRLVDRSQQSDARAGDLVFYGEDEAGPWLTYAPASQGNTECPWWMRVGAYERDEVLHLTSGLLLRKAPGFEVRPSYAEDPFPIDSGDTICLSANGEVLHVDIFFGY